MARMHPVGIDLGTTQSVIAYVNAEGNTEILLNSEEETLTPSVVLIDKGKAVVGKRALEASINLSGQVAECAKRDMGLSSYSRTVGNRLLPPEVIQGFILRQLRNDILLRLNDNFQVVIAVPAYFDEKRRQATIDAAKMSGLEVLDIVNEPTAAALAFGQTLGYLNACGAAKQKTNALVYDLGGGTFDVTVVQLDGLRVTTLATDGDVRLGGYDWDLRLSEHAKQRFIEKHPNCKQFDSDFEFHLRRLAEQAKHELSESAITRIVMNHDGGSLDVELSRQQFKEISADLLERTAFTTQQTLREAGLNWSNIDRILLVGGSTRMPMVREMLSNLSGLSPETTIHPDEAVARGAAIFAVSKLREKGLAADAPNLRITDVASHSLGIEGIDERTLRKENISLIARNSSLPKEVVREFVTKEDDQNNVLVRLLEGESSQPEHCSELGRARIKNLPRGLQKGTKVKVVYRLDSNGRLSVNANIPGVGSAAQIDLQRVKSITNSRLDSWKKIVCRDGGLVNYDDIDRLIESTLNDYEPAATDSPYLEKPGLQNIKSKEATLEPAIQSGAPKAASDGLKRTVRDHKRANAVGPMQTLDLINRRRQLKKMFFILGHVIFSLVGIIAGILMLCWFRPELQENLPNWLQEIMGEGSR
ncbi:MAG TPA: hypothetical protein DHW22_11555 [Planctomycetaceae bacterium]|nr:hypothetical protein [Planctomycetaceae bacterium]